MNEQSSTMDSSEVPSTDEPTEEPYSSATDPSESVEFTSMGKEESAFLVFLLTLVGGMVTTITTIIALMGVIIVAGDDIITTTDTMDTPTVTRSITTTPTGLGATLDPVMMDAITDLTKTNN